MDSDVLNRILGCKDLPSLPAVALRVIELTGDENVSLDELAQTIQNDQGLSAKILRTINSSFYGLREPCSTIQRALVMMGLKPIKMLALGFSLVGAVEAGKDNRFDYVDYWRRALYSAIAAKTLLERCKMSDHADEAFLGALLQDIGMLAMYKALGDEYLPLIEQTGGSHRQLSKIELEAYELQHSDLGAMLASRWKLPDSLVMPVKYHDRPTAAPRSASEVVRAVALGILIHEALDAEAPGFVMKQAYERANMWFSMSREDLDEVACLTGERAGELSRSFELDTGNSPDAEGVLERARQAIESSNDESVARGDLCDPDTLLIDGDQIDEETGVFNIRGMQSVVRSAFHLCGQRGDPLSLVVVSFDGLGGEDSSDSKRASTLLKEQFQPMGGVVGRLGQDLFAVVLGGTARAAVTAQADALLGATPGVSWCEQSDRPGPTVSIGMAIMDRANNLSFDSPEQLLAAAVKAVQSSRTSGGNVARVFVPKAA